MAYLTKRMALTNAISGLIGCSLGILLVHVAGWEGISWIAIGVPILSGVVIAPALVRVWNARRS